ncbi:MAG TPA: hypothetical protein DET46_06840 [Comamonadaceae bacterium]|nr:hypothetical protein [Comamonadaceae bacterium]
MDGQAVACGIGDGLDGCQRVRDQAQAALPQELRCTPVAQQVAARAPVGGHGHGQHTVAAVGAGHMHFGRLRARQRVQARCQGRVEHLARRIARHVMDHQRLLRATAERHAVEVHVGRAIDQLLGAGGKVQAHQRQLVAAPVGQRPGFAPVVVQTEDAQPVPAAPPRHLRPAAGSTRALQETLVALHHRARQQAPRPVHPPPDHVARVGGQQRGRTAFRVHAVQVEDLLVALVRRDDEVGRALHRFGKLRGRARRGHELAQPGVGAFDPAGVDAGVLVPSRVGGDGDPAAVGAEAEGARTDAKRLGIVAIHGLHPDRRHHTIGAEPGDALPVG